MKLLIRRTLCAILFIANAPAFALTDERGALTYEQFAGAAIITGCFNICQTDLVIPSTVYGLSVTGIGDYAFKGEQLTSVELPDTIINIGVQAFTYNQLATIDFPANLQTIGTSAFFGNKLSSVTLPGTVISVGRSAFGDNNLDNVLAGGQPIHVSFEPNEDGTSLHVTGCLVVCPADLVIPSAINGLSVSTIANGAFSSKQISTLNIGQGVRDIGVAAFFDNNLSQVNLPSGVEVVQANAFQNNALTSITLPNTLVNIGRSAFAGNQLVSLAIPYSVTIIGQTAFYENALTSVGVPDGLIELGSAAFGKNQMSSVSWLGNELNWSFQLNDGLLTITGCATYCSPPRANFPDLLQPWDLTIPATVNGYPVVAIGDYAFGDVFAENLVLPEGLISIGTYAFANNYFPTVSLPNSLESVGEYAFLRSGIETLALGDSLVSIGIGAFQGNYLSSLIIPDSVQTIGDESFRGNDIAQLDLGSGVASIGAASFAQNNLVELLIPATVLRIDEGAFIASELTDLTFLGDRPTLALQQFNTQTMQSVFTFSNEPAFPTLIQVCDGTQGWSNLAATFNNTYESDFWDPGYTTLRSGDCRDTDKDGLLNYKDTDDDNDGVVDNEDAFRLDPLESLDTDSDGIGNNADLDDDGDQVSDLDEIALGSDPLDFNSCIGGACGTALTYTVNPDGVSATATGCVSSCPSRVVIPSKVDGYTITVIGDYAFRAIPLSSVSFPDTVVSVGKYSFADNRLSRITLPDSVVTVESNAFSNNEITELIFGEGLESLGSFAFSNKTGVANPAKLQLLHFKGDFPVFESRISIDLAAGGLVAYCSDRTGWDSDVLLGNSWVTPVPDCDLDGVLDAFDVFPKVSIGDRTDTDGDGAPDTCDLSCLNSGMLADADDDGDGVLDDQELIDGTDPRDPLDYVRLSGRVYHWSRHAALGEAVIERGSSGQDLVYADAAGYYTFERTDPGVHMLSASLGISDRDLERTITSADALAALKIAVGLNPNSDPDGAGPLPAMPVSPYQLIAADMNQDGRVTSGDALAILKIAVGLSSALEPFWALVADSAPVWQTHNDKNAVFDSRQGFQFEYPDTQEVYFAGVLVGDVNSTWSPPSDAATLSVENLIARRSANGAPLSLWGLRDPNDIEAPVITLAGRATMNIELGSSYQEPGAQAVDAVDGSVDVLITGSVGTELGVYTVTYTAVDLAGNVAELTRVVQVVEPGKFVVLGASPEEILEQLTLEQKAAQLVQGEISAVSLDDVRRYGIGSVLNGGGSYPNGNRAATAAEWRGYAQSLREASTDTSLGSAGIPIVWGSDAVHGHNNVRGATLFPHNIGLGAARNPELIQAIGEATAKEVSVTGIDWVFAPTVAQAQDFRWGRTYESYSNDSGLVESYAQAFVTGLQSLGLGATAKHFIGDGGTIRGIDQGDTVLEDGALLDKHGSGYVGAIGAGVQSVMASFNSINGEKVHGSERILNGMLRDQLGFRGMVVADWNGIGQVPGCSPSSCPQAINAGIDMVMAPYDWKALRNSIVSQVQQGQISEQRLDEAVLRVLEFKQSVGLLSPIYEVGRGVDESVLGGLEHRELARQAVRESLVLLKNNGNILPLDSAQRILLVGEHADSVRHQAGGWSVTWQGDNTTNSDFPGATTIKMAVQQAVEGAGGEFEYSATGTYSQKPDAVIAVLAEDPYAEGAGDLGSLIFDPARAQVLDQVQTLRSEGVPVVTIALTGRPMWMNPQINDSDAFIAAWLPGTEAGGIADLVLSALPETPEYDFVGRLPFPWPYFGNNSYDDNKPVNEFLFHRGYGLSTSDVESVPELDERPFQPIIIPTGG